jgi:hypothetical protein
MADKKVSELTAITSISGDDLLMVVNDPLGTPASNKITITNLFSEVPVETEFSKNTTFSSNTMNVTANLVYQGTELQSMIDDRMQVANTTAKVNAVWTALTSTNTAINSRVTLVNTNLTETNTAIRTLISDRMQVANVNTVVNDRLQVANAVATYATKAYAASNTYLNTHISTASKITQANTIIANISANTPIIRVTDAFGIRGTVGSAPSSNNTTIENLSVGTMFFDTNYLYIATDATTIKRVSLEVFS